MKYLFFLLVSLPLFAQTTTFENIPGTSYPALEAILNKKLKFDAASGVPTGNCTTGKQIYTNTDNGDLYWCPTANTWRKFVLPDSAGNLLLGGATCPAGTPAGSICLTGGIVIRGTDPTLRGVITSASAPTEAQSCPDLAGGWCRATEWFRTSDGAQCITTFTSATTVNTTVCGGGGGGYDPMDFTAKVVRDSFCSGVEGISTVNDVSSMKWTIASSTGGSSYTYASSTAASPCGLSITTGSTSGNNAFLTLSGDPIAITLGTSTNWELKTALYLTSTTSSSFGLGLGANFYAAYCDPAGTVANCVGVVYGPGDTHYRFVACTSYTCSAFASTVTATANTLATVRIFGDGTGAIFGSVNGETAIAINANVPAIAAVPAYTVATSTAAAKTLVLKEFAAKWTGL